MNYKGTRQRMKVGDKVYISHRWAKELGVDRQGTITKLDGFITVRVSNGDEVDFDARSITPR